LFEPLFVWFGVNEFERVGGDYFFVELFVFAVVKQRIQTISRAEPKMITAMRADLKRFFEFAFVERAVAFQTFDENTFGFYFALFVRVLFFDFGIIAAKPSHINFGFAILDFGFSIFANFNR